MGIQRYDIENDKVIKSATGKYVLYDECIQYDRFDEGYSSGHDDGYGEGYHIGVEDGYNEGYSDRNKERHSIDHNEISCMSHMYRDWRKIKGEIKWSMGKN